MYSRTDVERSGDNKYVWHARKRNVGVCTVYEKYVKIALFCNWHNGREI
jgi:hypothetical protein